MKTITILLALILSSIIQAQNVDFKKKNFSNEEEYNQAKDALEQGDSFFFEGNFEKALPRFRNAQKLNPSNALLNFKIGACYLKIDEIEKSMPYFETAKKLDPKVDSKIDFALAQSYQANKEFDKAVESYHIYLAGLSKNKRLLEEPMVQKHIDICSTEIQKKQTRIEEAKEAKEKRAETKIESAAPKKEEKPITEAKPKVVKEIPKHKEEAQAVKKEITKAAPSPKKVSPAVPVASTTNNNITYRLQITSTSLPASDTELKKIYSGELRITNQKIGSVYKYFVGDFKSKADAMKAKSTSGVSDAFIVKFKNGKKM